MEELLLCRVCLSENVQLYYIGNTALQEIYQKLTSMPLKTEDKRSMLVCYMCRAQLRKCHRMMVSCLRAEQLLTEMYSQTLQNGNKISTANIRSRNLSFNLSKSPMDQINITDMPHSPVHIKHEIPTYEEECKMDEESAQDTPEHKYSLHTEVDIKQADFGYDVPLTTDNSGSLDNQTNVEKEGFKCKQGASNITKSKMNSKFYKYCVVPQCESTTIKTPDKLFIYVPLKEKIRKKWLKLAKRDPKAYSTDSRMYFCEDHFDLPNNMENYMEYHIKGYVSKIRLKPGCIPTKFECQPRRRKRTCVTKDPAHIKEQRRMIVEKCLRESDAGLIKGLPSNTNDKSVQVTIAHKLISKATQVSVMLVDRAVSPYRPF